MSLDVPVMADGHPNRMPIRGVLTKIDEPSDAPPHGSQGKRVLLTRAAAERAIPSLLGMALDLNTDWDGHNPTNKIGIVTAAHIDGNELLIEGYVWASDFPRESLRIHMDQASLGFSFEAQQIAVESLQADPLVITDCVFTGAAILMKDAAAYRTTALAAAAAKKHETEFVMDDETKAALADLMAGAVKPLHTAIESIQGELTAQGQKVAVLHEKIEANAATMSKVEPLAGKLENCAASMEAAGVGLEPNNGHVFHLRRMASHMRSEAQMGRMPASYSGAPQAAPMGQPQGYYASAEQPKPVSAPRVEDSDAFKAIQASLTELSGKLTDTTAKLAAAEDRSKSQATMLADIQAGNRQNAPAPDRKTLSPQITRLLAKEGIGDTELADGKQISASVVAKITEGLSLSERLRLKGNLASAGLIDPAASA